MEMPRYLVSFDSRKLPVEETDVLIIGSGVAGLCTAIEVTNSGKRALVVNKSTLDESNTRYAQGGIAAAFDGRPESVESHVADTLAAGDALCDEGVVRAVVESGPNAIEFLRKSSCQFDESESGEPEVANEAAHSSPRVLHSGGDATGHEMARALIATARLQERLRTYENCFVVDLLTDDEDDSRCIGALVFLEGKLRIIYAGATVLATGGVGRLYRESSNPKIATGDGHAMSLRAGVVLRDLEMVQFHPTLSYVSGAPRVLVTEALRGAGAVLRGSSGERFMERYDDRGELAPRDVLSRAIVKEMELRNETAVFLDVTHFSEQELRRFPGFASLCRDYEIDVSRSWVPVRPGPHYMMGGLKTDLEGRTSLDGLYAVGEASSSGLHGANRLASNSLLEGVVLGRRLGKHLANTQLHDFVRSDIQFEGAGDARNSAELDYYDLRDSFRSSMWRHMGVEREAAGLLELLKRIKGWHSLWMSVRLSHPREWALANMHQLGYAMASSALIRRESMGAHYRRDCPGRTPESTGQHVEFTKFSGAFWERPRDLSGQ